MNVLMNNGSSHAAGNAYLALQEMAGVFKIDDIVNETAAKFDACDGLAVGSPVYYVSANTTLAAFLTRLFFSTRFCNHIVTEE